MRATKTIYKTRTTSLHTKPTTLTIRPSSVRQQTHTQVWQLTTSRLNTQQQQRGPSTKQQPEESTTKTTTIAKNRKGTQFLGSLHAPQWARTPAKGGRVTTYGSMTCSMYGPWTQRKKKREKTTIILFTTEARHPEIADLRFPSCW